MTPLTPLDRTATEPRTDVPLLSWLTPLTTLMCVVAVVILGLTGHTEAAVAVGVIGGGLGAATGIQITVNIRR
ncbi:hypothetical protein [Streptomyces cucumeris]|uniref:hypothetical protein n=1 Tax=Streptomyces cucumeris TaxID=2962890 RepID=UPI003D7641D4